MGEYGGEPVDQKSPGIDDPGVHQGRHGRGSGHGVGEPRMKEKLCRTRKGGHRYQTGYQARQWQPEKAVITGPSAMCVNIAGKDHVP